MFDHVVLVVAQDKGLASLIRELIRSEIGVHTVFAADKEMALERIRKGRPSAVVLDVTPLEPWSIEVIREIKGDVLTKDIPVIALATQGAGSQKAHEAGCNAWSPKPLDLDGLLRTVSACLSDTTGKVVV